MRSVHIESMIQRLYHHMSITEPDSLDIETIAQKLNIDLLFWDEETETVCYRGQCRILLDDRLPCTCQKEDFACHVLHILKRRSGPLSSLAKDAAYHRVKECVFAKHFWVPSFMLKNMTIPGDKKEAVQLISSVFGVNDTLAEDRLNYLRMLEHV